MNNKNKIIRRQDDWVVFTIESKTHGRIEVTIDGEDIFKVRHNNWYVGGKRKEIVYVRTNMPRDDWGCRGTLLLHNLIMDHTPEFLTVDHINGDRMDNRKKNLRLADRSIQSINRKPYGKVPYRGVILQSGKYPCGNIKVDGRTIYLGCFKTTKEAALAFDQYVIKHNLPHSLNFPDLVELEKA